MNKGILEWFILWILNIASGQFIPDDFRLVDINTGPNITRGRLEYRLDSRWHTVCQSGFALQEADVACNALGFLYAAAYGSTASVNSLPGSLGQPVVSMSCSFSSLSTCAVEVTNCSHFQDVGLTCTTIATPMRLVSEGGRAVVTDSGVGILQVFINGVWGTVCGDGFRLLETRAACRQLGFEDAVGYSTISSLQYEEVSQSVPVWLTGVSCSTVFRLLRLNGQVLTDLRRCRHRKEQQPRCNHTTDAIISCRKPGALRLVHPGSSLEQIRATGRLELFWNGKWGRVCGTDITDTTALVACRQLGFNSVDCYDSITDLGIREDSNTASRALDVVISDVDCTSQFSTSLLQCFYVNGSSSSDCQLNVDDLALSCHTRLDVLTRDSSCSLGTTNNHILSASLASAAVVVVIVIVISTISLIYYCRRRKIYCIKYGHSPVRHEPVIVGPHTASSANVEPPASTGPRTSQASGPVRHDYLRQNPDRIRHLRQNSPRQQQPRRTPSRRLNNWRYQRNFVSTMQQSATVTVNRVEHFTSDDVSNGHNFTSSFSNFQSTGQDSFFVSIFTNGPQGRQTSGSSTEERNSRSANAGISHPTETSRSDEEEVPSDSTLQDQPPPSYENAQTYPPAYTSSKDNLLHHEEAPPYSSGPSSSPADSDLELSPITT